MLLQCRDLGGDRMGADGESSRRDSRQSGRKEHVCSGVVVKGEACIKLVRRPSYTTYQCVNDAGVNVLGSPGGHRLHSKVSSAREETQSLP